MPKKAELENKPPINEKNTQNGLYSISNNVSRGFGSVKNRQNNTTIDIDNTNHDKDSFKIHNFSLNLKKKIENFTRSLK